jgi:hypothetical protein
MLINDAIYYVRLSYFWGGNLFAFVLLIDRLADL